MKISILVNEVAGGWSPNDVRLGGTEESVVRWSEELANRGHAVHVFRNGHDNSWIEMTGYPGSINYWPREMYRADADICINIKSSEIDPIEPTLYLTNETDATDKDLSKYLGVIWPSEWAMDNIPVNNKNLFVLPHGYDEKTIYPDKKIPKQCLYASSPDRGLEVLLRAWPEVYAAHPDVTLKITYGAAEYDVPGIEFMGECTESEMEQLYRESDIWCHPCTGGELYGITGIKAQAAGCWPVYIPTMALAETVTYGTVCTKDNYAKKLIEALDGHPEPPVNPYPTWSSTTDRLEEIIKTVLES